MKKAVVVIPLSKNKKLNKFEELSLNHNIKILLKHPIVFVAPKNVNYEFVKKYKKKIEYFSEDYFGSPRAHSKLLMSKEFYRRFEKFEYVLICHLDAFVFSDKLNMFCDMQYDYIGAPIPKRLWPTVGCQVGNGGFSLRKINSCLKVLNFKHDIMESVSLDLKENFLNAEDMFWSYCSTVKDLNFRIPIVKEALNFSMEWDVCHGYRNVKNKRPFACHGWYRLTSFMWGDYIRKEGYNIPSLPNYDEYDIWDAYIGSLKSYFLVRLMRKENLKTLNTILGKYKINGPICLWGYGVEGKKWFKFFKQTNIIVEKVYDSNDFGNKDGHLTDEPTCLEINNSEKTIFISTSKYEQEIKELIYKYDTENKIKIISGKEFLKYIIDEYMGRFYNMEMH